jgi:hypothetical protein
MALLFIQKPLMMADTVIIYFGTGYGHTLAYQITTGGRQSLMFNLVYIGADFFQY